MRMDDSDATTGHRERLKSTGVSRSCLFLQRPREMNSHLWADLAVCLSAGLVMFWWHPRIDVNRKPVLLLDAAGLALFAVTGTQKALAAGLNPAMAAVMGMLSGIGGGILRDILVNETPSVLRADLYAVAGLSAGLAVVGGYALISRLFWA